MIYFILRMVVSYHHYSPDLEGETNGRKIYFTVKILVPKLSKLINKTAQCW